MEDVGPKGCGEDTVTGMYCCTSFSSTTVPLIIKVKCSADTIRCYEQMLRRWQTFHGQSTYYKRTSPHFPHDMEYMLNLHANSAQIHIFFTENSTFSSLHASMPPRQPESHSPIQHNDSTACILVAFGGLNRVHATPVHVPSS